MQLGAGTLFFSMCLTREEIFTSNEVGAAQKPLLIGAGQRLEAYAMLLWPDDASIDQLDRSCLE
jgi:hypothetical protein